MKCDTACTAQILKAIAHSTRLKILCALNTRELCVQVLVTETGTTQSNISQHLAHLKTHGIVTTRREANRIYYRVRDTQLLQLISVLRNIYCAKPA